MKRIKHLFFFSLLSFSFCAKAQITSPDTMVHRIFNSLQTQDEKAYVALYPDAAMMKRLMVKVLGSIADQMKQSAAMDSTMKGKNIDSLLAAELDKRTSPEETAKMEKGFAKSFHAILDEGKQKGIDWNGAKLTSFTYDTTAQTDPGAIQFFGEGLTAMKGVIYFAAGGKDYQMRFDKAMFLPSEGRWYGGELKDLGLKGEVWPTEGDETEKGKTKTKTPAAKTKAKTKTASGKVKAKTRS